MAKPKQLVDDIGFIFAECVRLQAELRRTPKNVAIEDALCWLPHPSGMGHMSCGRMAFERLDRLVAAALARVGLGRRVDAAAMRSTAGEMLVQRFLRDQREVDVKQVGRLLSAVGKVAQEECEDITHFIPCTLMLSDEPDVLDLGPVRFLNRATFRRRALSLLKSDAVLHRDEDNQQAGRRLLAEGLSHYRSFGWVAEVTIKGCQERVSKRFASQAVTSALDCLHLILGVEFTDKMRIGGPDIREDRRARLRTGPAGGLDVSISTVWPGQVGFGAGWSKILATPDRQRELQLCAVALETAVDPDLDRPLSRRFLDAAQWYGEASRDDRPATKIVKYVTSLERMLMTDEREQISAIVSERAAALAFHPEHADRDIWRKRTKAVYDLRSRLLHGSLSPLDLEIASQVAQAAQVGQRSLLMCAHGLGEETLRTADASSERLARWFAGVLALADKLEAEPVREQPIDGARP